MRGHAIAHPADPGPWSDQHEIAMPMFFAARATAPTLPPWRGRTRTIRIRPARTASTTRFELLCWRLGESRGRTMRIEAITFDAGGTLPRASRSE